MGMLRTSKVRNFCKGSTLTLDIFKLSLSSKLDIDITAYFMIFFLAAGTRL